MPSPEVATLEDLERRLERQATEAVAELEGRLSRVREGASSSGNIGSSSEVTQMLQAGETSFKSYCKTTAEHVLYFTNDEDGFELIHTVPVGKQAVDAYLQTTLSVLRSKYPPKWSFSGGEQANIRINELEDNLKLYADSCIRDLELGSFDGRRIYKPAAHAQHHMHPFARAYAFEKRYQLDRLRLTLEKAEKAYEAYQPETIDFCKCALEGICKAVLREKNDLRYSENPELPQLIKYTLSALSYESDRIRGGISNIFSGLGEIRNSNTIAGHGMPESQPLPSKMEICLYVSSFSHVIDMLLHLLEEDEVDITHTIIPFSTLESHLDLETLNEEIDSSVDIEYVKDDGILFMEGKEIRPSEILYLFDRPSYKGRFEAHRKAMAESEELEE